MPWCSTFHPRAREESPSVWWLHYSQMSTYHSIFSSPWFMFSVGSVNSQSDWSDTGRQALYRVEVGGGWVRGNPFFWGGGCPERDGAVPRIPNTRPGQLCTCSTRCGSRPGAVRTPGMLLGGVPMTTYGSFRPHSGRACLVQAKTQNSSSVTSQFGAVANGLAQASRGPLFSRTRC